MDQVRQISDSRVLAAMTHPLRRRLLAVLKVDGPMTVSMLAERTDQAIGNVSHHLRVLANADLVDEVPELARDRRERWWRRTSGALRWSTDDFADDPAAEAIARAAESINANYQASIVHAWDVADEDVRASWPRGPFATDSWMRLTDDELAQLADDMTVLLRRWADRSLPDDGEDRRTVLVFGRGVPGQP